MSEMPLDAFRRYPGEIINSRTGKPTEAPQGYVIIGQTWPCDQRRNPRDCFFCSGRAGITDDALRRHLSAPEDRPVCCYDCAELLHEMSAHLDAETGTEQHEADLSLLGWPKVLHLLKIWRSGDLRDRKGLATRYAKELFAQCAPKN